MEIKINRIKYLDGIRGIAIILVIGFHAFSRWPELVPYGDQFKNITIFKYGYLGVDLFFLLSGFVILMTLEKSCNMKTFLVRRWLRLFPAMLVATILIFLSAGIFYERPSGKPSLFDVVPGLLFIQPSILANIFNINTNGLEGVFWSLYVEVKFYLIFGFSYYFFGSKRSVFAISGLFGITTVLYIINKFYYLPSLIILILKIGSFEYFGWFAAGAYLYRFNKNRKNNISLYFSLFFVILSSLLAAYSDIGALIFCLLLSFLFIAPLFIDLIKKILESNILLFFGFISYPLYLIHENSMISMIIKFHKVFPIIPSVLLPIAPIFILIVISFIIAKFVEPKVRLQFLRYSGIVSRLYP